MYKSELVYNMISLYQVIGILFCQFYWSTIYIQNSSILSVVWWVLTNVYNYVTSNIDSHDV